MTPRDISLITLLSSPSVGFEDFDLLSEEETGLVHTGNSNVSEEGEACKLPLKAENPFSILNSGVTLTGVS